MKKVSVLFSVGLLALLMGGCVAAIGNSGSHRSSGTLGQQLIDLQKAREAGAITDSEYQVQKDKLLGKK